MTSRPVDLAARRADRPVTVPGSAVRVEIDAENVFPDADRSNNVWSGEI